MITVSIAIEYRNIPKVSPGAYIFQRPFLRGLFFEGPFYYYLLSTLEGNLCFKIDWASLKVGSKFTVFAFFFTLYLRAISKYKPLGASGAYIWRGEYKEGPIFGILRQTRGVCKKQSPPVIYSKLKNVISCNLRFPMKNLMFKVSVVCSFPIVTAGIRLSSTCILLMYPQLKLK